MSRKDVEYIKKHYKDKITDTFINKLYKCVKNRFKRIFENVYKKK